MGGLGSALKNINDPNGGVVFAYQRDPERYESCGVWRK